MNLKVKVCGMRETYNITGLRQIPVDFIGLICYEKSSRYLEEKGDDLSFLKESIQRFGDSNQFIKKVGVFVDAEESTIKRLLIVQFEGFLPAVDEYYRYNLSASPVVANYPFRSNAYAFDIVESIAANPTIRKR